MNQNDTSVYPQNLRIRFYVMYFFYSFVTRMWETSIVFFIADVTNNSFKIVALAGLLSSLSVFLLMPIVGQWLDASDRLHAVRRALIIKLVAVSMAYIMCSFVTKKAPEGLVYIIPLLCGIASLAFATVSQSIEKDWVIVLSGSDSHWLAETNSVMCQIDLGCNSAAPAFSGLLFALLPQTALSVLLLIMNAVATLCLHLFLKVLYSSWPALIIKIRQSPTLIVNETAQLQTADDYKKTTEPHMADMADFSTAEEDAEVERQNGIINITHSSGTQTYQSLLQSQSKSSLPTISIYSKLCQIIHQTIIEVKLHIYDFSHSGCVGVMLSYSILFFTVLSFGSIMIVYLRYAGLPDYWIGIARGISSLFGFIGAVIFPNMKKRLGLFNSGLLAIGYQSSLMIVAAIACISLNTKPSMFVILTCTLLSRTGLWLFDLCARQIAQGVIKEEVRGRVNGQWGAIIAFFDMAVYAMAIIVSDAKHFWILVILSATTVCSAALMFTLTNQKQFHLSCTNMRLETVQSVTS